MKKFFLLMASGSIALSSVAQQRALNFDAKSTPSTLSKSYALPTHTKKTTASKTTAAPSRTYGYYAYFDTLRQDLTGLGTANSGGLMWQDDKHLGGFTSGYDTITMVSMLAMLHPQAASLNTPSYFVGEMKIATEPYIVDSVHVYGVYDFKATATQVDTLVLSFVYGDGSASATGNGIFSGGRVSGGHYGSWPVISARYDTTSLSYARINASWGTPNTYVVKVPLGPTSFGDTFSTGVWHKNVTIPGGMSVPGGNQVAMSYSFKSGVTAPAYDTIFRMDGSMKYNMWRPLIKFAADGSGNADWASLDTSDYNQGLYKTLPHDANGWDFIYVPQWAWSTSSGTAASSLQHPIVDWHIRCATCGNVTSVDVKEVATVTKVNAYPNPANNELNIPFTLANTADVNITLSNMLGQVVATKNMSNVSNGTAIFNVANLPSGLYTYTLTVNGTRNSGRIVINH